MNRWRSLALVFLLAVAPAVRADAPVITFTGSYTIAFSGPVTVTQTANSITFTWGLSPAPKPTPPPAPTPSPTPTPVPEPPPPPTPTPTPVTPATAKLWVIGIYDYDALPSYTMGQLSIRTSTTVGPALSGLDAIWRDYDKGNPAITSWMGDVSGITLPAYLIIGPDANNKAKIVDKGPMPADEASLIALVKKLRGKS